METRQSSRHQQRQSQKCTSSDPLREVAALGMNDWPLSVLCVLSAFETVEGVKNGQSLGLVLPSRFDRASEGEDSGCKKQGMEHLAVNVSFQLADATNLAFLDESFDYASISPGLHDKEKLARERVLCELKRVVKQHGALIFIDFQVPMPNNVWAAFERTIEFLIGRSNYRAFKEYLRSGGLEQLLRSHGLRGDSTAYLKSELIVITKALNNQATISPIVA